jgi:glycosyltransferase involved in cell wall biosynthesis
MAKVTVLMAVYNAQQWLSASIGSMMNQTLRDWQLICVDDASTDGSLALLREWEERDSRIEVIALTKNGGQAHARNIGLKRAKGDYICFLDADDTIDANTIELLYDNVKRYGADIVYGSYERIETFNSEVKHELFRFESKQFLQENEFASWAYDAYGNLPAMVWNMLIDIDLFRKNALRFPSVSYWEDFAMTTDLPTYVHRAVLLPDITYHYNCRVNSASNFQERSHIDKKEIEN